MSQAAMARHVAAVDRPAELGLSTDVSSWGLTAVLHGVGLALWLLSLPRIDLAAMDDLGLAPQLPVTAWAALVLVTIGFVRSLLAVVLRPILLMVGVGLIALMLFGLPAMVEPSPRFSITYVHVGFAEAIARTGELFPNYDARFDWPIFFALVAFLSEVARFEPLAVANWVPLLSNLLYLGPLWVIFRTFTADRRLIWLGLWIFIVANWIGQDYLSPQGFNLLLFLTVVAILLRWFRPGGGAWAERLIGRAGERLSRLFRRAGTGMPDEEPNPAASRASRPALVMVVAALGLVIASSHQLTPFVVFVAVSALVVSGICTLRGLPLVIGVTIAAWLSYMTVTYLAGHLPALLGEVGRAGDVAASNVEGRIQGSDQHLVIVFARLAFSLVLWIVAVVGGLRRMYNGQVDLAAALLAALPFGFLALQSYGGEILLRVYLFALPFMAFFAAAAFLSRRGRPGAFGSAALAVVLLVAVVAAPWVRYGNERADYYTPLELAAAEELYRIVPDDSMVVSGNYNGPFRYRDLERYEYRSVGIYLAFSDIDAILYLLRTTDAPASYLLLTRSMQATSEMFSGMQPGEWETLLEDLRALPSLDVVFENRDAIILRLVRGAA